MGVCRVSIVAVSAFLAYAAAKVAGNLGNDLAVLRQSVEETFGGAPAAVAEKEKQTSKASQYESYQIRRGKKGGAS